MYEVRSDLLLGLGLGTDCDDDTSTAKQDLAHALDGSGSVTQEGCKTTSSCPHQPGRAKRVGARRVTIAGVETLPIAAAGNMEHAEHPPTA